MAVGFGCSLTISKDTTMNQGDGPSEICYICAEPLSDSKGETGPNGVRLVDRDHVVPRGLFNIEDRGDPIVLPAHRDCNQSYAKDDEYFRLCLSARAAQHEPKALRVFEGKAMRGFHRPDSHIFKKSILQNIRPVGVVTKSGHYLGQGAIWNVHADRIKRVVRRIIRGLHSFRTGKVLPGDWPVDCELLEVPSIAELEAYLKVLDIRFLEVGDGTFLYAYKHLGDNREAFFWLVFYRSIHFWGGTGGVVKGLFDADLQEG